MFLFRPHAPLYINKERPPAARFPKAVQPRNLLESTQAGIERTLQGLKVTQAKHTKIESLNKKTKPGSILAPISEFWMKGRLCISFKMWVRLRPKGLSACMSLCTHRT